MYFEFLETGNMYCNHKVLMHDLKYLGGAYICYKSYIQGEFIVDLYVESCMSCIKGEYKCQNT